MESYNFFELNYENIADFIQTEFKVLYACWDEEISDNGKKHIHLYMELDHKVRFSTIQKKLTGAHIDRRYGSPTEARQYIEKPLGMLFKGKEKSHTVVKPMQELGSEQKRYREFVNSDSVVKHTNAQGKTSISVNREVYYLSCRLWENRGCQKEIWR